MKYSHDNYREDIAEWLKVPKNHGIMDEQTSCFYKFPNKTIVRIGSDALDGMLIPYISEDCGHVKRESLKEAKRKAYGIPPNNSEILIFHNMLPEHMPDIVTIRDLEITNYPKGATFLNGKRIDHNPVRLEHEDIIELGLGPEKYRLQFLMQPPHSSVK